MAPSRKTDLMMTHYLRFLRSSLILGGLALFGCQSTGGLAQSTAAPEMDGPRDRSTYTTYCNPLDIDYTYMSHYRGRADVSYRSGADPAAVNFNGKYYLFVTRSHGYWVSDDLIDWTFVRPQAWYFNGSKLMLACLSRRAGLQTSAMVKSLRYRANLTHGI